MAICKFINAILSGKVGGSVYTSNRGGQVVRVWRKPSNHQTVRQTQARANLSTASQAYKALTNAQRAAWVGYAVAHTILNRLGESITLSGVAMFNALNTRTLDRGGPTSTLPPTGVGPANTLSQSAVVSAAAGTAVVTFTPSPIGATKRLALWACPPGPASLDQSIKSAKLVGYSSVNVASAASWLLPFSVSAGDYINLWVAVLADDGRQSPFIKIRQLIAA